MAIVSVVNSLVNYTCSDNAIVQILHTYVRRNFTVKAKTQRKKETQRTTKKSPKTFLTLK